MPAASGTACNGYSANLNAGDATLTAVVTPTADLTISGNAAPNPVSAASNVTFSVQVNNAGPSAATGVNVTTTVPGNLTYVSGTIPGGSCTLTLGVVTCSVPSLAASNNVTALIVMKVNATGALSASFAVTSN